MFIHAFAWLYARVQVCFYVYKQASKSCLNARQIKSRLKWIVSLATRLKQSFSACKNGHNNNRKRTHTHSSVIPAYTCPAAGKAAKQLLFYTLFITAAVICVANKIYLPFSTCNLLFELLGSFCLLLLYFFYADFLLQLICAVVIVIWIATLAVCFYGPSNLVG